MNYPEADAAIKNYFATQWNNATEVAYDDVKFDVPQGQTWARLNIQFADGSQASTGSPGSNKFRKEGIVTVQVFAPEGGASVSTLTTVNQVMNIFEAKARINGILFKNVRAISDGNDGAGWHQVNVKADFEFDTIK